MNPEQWRYRCPRGHTTWESRNSNTKPSKSDYYCISCQRTHDDGHFDELVDVKDPADHHIDDPAVTVV